MKLTETKLKQMILEMMSQSENYYNKLKTLMTTEEGYLQAESLFDVVKDQLNDKHRMFITNLLEPLHMGRQVREVALTDLETSKRLREIEKSFDDPNQASQNELDEYEKALEISKSASDAHRSANHRLNNHLSTMLQAGVENEIFQVAKIIAKKATRGEL